MFTYLVSIAVKVYIFCNTNVKFYVLNYLNTNANIFSYFDINFQHTFELYILNLFQTRNVLQLNIKQIAADILNAAFIEKIGTLLVPNFHTR